MNLSTMKKLLYAVAALLAVALLNAAGVLHTSSALGSYGLIGIAGMSWLTSEPLVTYLQSIGVLGSTGGVVTVRRVVAKTADYTVTAADFRDQVFFTTRGAVGAVNFTLPVVSAQLAGLMVTFKNAVDQNMTVTSNPADTLITDGDLQADSIAASTASHKICAEIEVFCDGTAFYASGKNVGATYTIAT